MVKEERHESDEDKKTKKESDLKKFLKKRSFLYLMCAVAFVVIVVPDMIAPSDLDIKLVENLISDEQNTAWHIVKSYKGADDDGFNLFDTMITQIENAYPNEKILKHNDTMLTVSVEEAARSAGHVFYEVNFTFKTYNVMEKYIWNVNIETEEIVPISDGARKMMNIVDFYD
jgi:hypothetical protein